MLSSTELGLVSRLEIYPLHPRQIPGFALMTCLETYANLRIFSELLHPNEISELLGLEATDTIPLNPESKYRVRRETNYWGWNSRTVVSSTDNLEHVAAITQRLSGKRALLDQLREKGCEIDICCYWVSSGQGGPLVDRSMLAALSQLDLEIWWDVYFGEESEYAEPVSEADAADGV